MILSVHLFLLIHITPFFCIPQHPRHLSSDAGDAGSSLFRQPGQLRLKLSGQSTKDDPVLKFVRPWELVGGSGKLQLLQKKLPHFSSIILIINKIISIFSLYPNISSAILHLPPYGAINIPVYRIRNMHIFLILFFVFKKIPKPLPKPWNFPHSSLILTRCR